MSPTTSSASPSTPSLWQQFEHRIYGLLADSSAATSQPPCSNTTSTPRPILWVIESDDLDQAREELTTQQIALMTIDSLTEASALAHREIICFWLPKLDPLEFERYLPIIIRSRDFNANHTVLVLNDAIDLRAFGFVHLPASPLQRQPPATTQQIKTKPALQAWQFNLFDYKPRPHWLNADYWANPENWDKFRW